MGMGTKLHKSLGLFNLVRTYREMGRCVRAGDRGGLFLELENHREASARFTQEISEGCGET